MESFLEVKFALVGAPPRPDFLATEGNIAAYPNAAPLPTTGIGANGDSQRSFSFEFTPPLADGSYQINDQLMTMRLHEKTGSLNLTETSGTISIDAFTGIYSADFTGKMKDLAGRDWDVMGKLYLEVVPQ